MLENPGCGLLFDTVKNQTVRENTVKYLFTFRYSLRACTCFVQQGITVPVFLYVAFPYVSTYVLWENCIFLDVTLCLNLERTRLP